MIPVKDYKGAKVAVLGLGRSGLATAAALRAGGAEPLLWDDSPEARQKAEAAGFALTALTRNGALYFGQISRGLYISIGCNGAGMLKGSMFGKLLGEMACGQQSPQLADALGFERPTWLPPEPLRRIAIVSTIQYQKYKAGIER